MNEITKKEEFTKTTTQNPSEPVRKDINRIKKETKESDKPKVGDEQKVEKK